MSNTDPTPKTPFPPAGDVTDPDKLLRVEEAAELLGIHWQTVHKLIRARRLPVVKIGRLSRVRRRDLDEYVAAQTIPAVRDAG
ncbi:helix-turn-helix domain-containing protein [Isoptericola sp. NPDC057391]|uniref:helix-turn-helix domain-containing protein n=1 Tax=Isoptericola sp. NPDC057391 TaxID=3346117 RepID=UPI00363B7EEF